jgi:hypothetical protein
MVFGFIGLLLAIVIFLFPKRIYTPEESSVIEKKEKIDEIIKMKLTNDLELNGQLKENSSGSESTPISDPDNYDDKIEINDSFLNNEMKIFNQNDQHNLTILNTLEQTGSIISIDRIAYYSSAEKISNKFNKDHSSFNELIKKSIFLFKNPVYVFVITAATIEGLLQNSFLAFAPLFLEYQYRLASGTSSLIIGLLSIPPLILGGLLSGIICKKLKNDTISCFKFLAVVLFVNIFVYAGFLLNCREPTLISDDSQMKNLLQQMSIQNENLTQTSCFKSAQNCNCDSKIFKPVCLSDSKDIYFQSPCLAGCSSFTQLEKLDDYYSNCSQSECDAYFESTSLKKQHTLKDGLCQTKSCELKLVVSYVCIFILMLLNAITFLPYLKVTIGCINSKEMNTIVLGLKQFFMNAFGTIPGPILFGTVIDATCSYWHTDSQDQSVCKIYNNEKFALGFGLLGIGFKTICFVLVILSLVFSIRSKKTKSITK